MAMLPTDAEIRRAVLDIVASKQIRPGEIINYVQMQIALSPRFRAAEFTDAINGMVADGLFTYDGGKFLKLTTAGFERV
jgi:hypothetical protein